MDKEEALKVASAFLDHIRTGDDTIIKVYSKEYIASALSFIPLFDRHKQWYKAMERRIDYFEQMERKSKDRWWDNKYIVGIIVGLIVFAITSSIIWWISR